MEFTAPKERVGGDLTSAAESVVRHKLVLLVEESVDALQGHASSLRHAGYYVVEVETVRSARDAVRALCPDVVVLDCHLPDGDGLALLETWRASRSAIADVPVIVLAASARRQDVDAARSAGADELVPKPCPGNVLALHVARALESSRPTRRIERVTP